MPATLEAAFSHFKYEEKWPAMHHAKERKEGERENYEKASASAIARHIFAICIPESHSLQKRYDYIEIE